MIKQLSVTQIEKFDHAQAGGCERRWFLEDVSGLRPDQTTQQGDGAILHDHLATYLRTGNVPEKRVKMGKVAKTTIWKGELPMPGADLFVEERFSRQPKFHETEKHEDGTPKWVPLDPTKTIQIAGAPMEGFIDLSFRRGDVPEVWDHKTSSSADNLNAYAKRGEDLIKTVQMPVYVYSEMRRWPDAESWRIAHHYVSRVGVHSFIRSAIVSRAEVEDRIGEISKIVERMKVVAEAKSQEEVPFNRRSCSAWLGCPMQSLCSAFKENKMSLKPEEAALFADLEAPAVTEAPAKKKLEIVDVSEDDDVAKLEAELAAKKAAKAKAAAEAEAAAKAKADAEAKRQYEAKLAAVQIPDSAPAESPIPDPKSDGGQPAPATAKGKGTKAAPVGPTSVTVTMDLATFDKVRAFLK